METRGRRGVNLRQALTRHGLAEIRALLEGGEPVRAGEAIAQLRDRAARATDLEQLEEAAKTWVQAREQADRGDFPQALQALERVQRLLPWAARTVVVFLPTTVRATTSSSVQWMGVEVRTRT